MKGQHPPDGPKTQRLTRFLRRLFTAGVLLLTLLFFFTAAGSGVLAGYMASLMKNEPVRSQEELRQKMNSWTQTSHAYFRDHSLLGDMRTDADRKWVKKEEVSPLLIDALLATEDHEFYRHHGISPRGILRAVYRNLVRGSVTSGGSTLTQQLVKNVILENREKVLERKAKEIWLALRLERMFNKDEILTFYLNSLYFGKGVHHRNLLGVQAASRGLFGVDAKDLNLAQAAYLAGMIQRPAALNPFHPETFETGRKRMETVLSRMEKTGKITPEARAEALEFDLKYSLARKGEPSAYSRRPFLMAAVEERAAKILMKVEGLDAGELSRQGLYRSTLEQYRKKVLTGGYRIHTTVDPHLHRAVNKTARDDRLYAKPITYTVNTGAGKKKVENAREEVGVTLLDVRTGDILAFVGGRDFEQGQTNHALNTRRQPGSTIKPLLDYGPALDRETVTPGAILVDEPLEAQGQNGEKKTYKNYNDQYQGPVTVREALKWSLNIPAIKLLRETGVRQGFAYLKAMDFPIHPMDGEASAIGGFTRGFTVERMTAGYAMLANGGIYREPHLIDSIEDADGKVIYRYSPRAKRILSPQAAYLTTDMLQDVMKSGTGRWVGARAPGHHLAGKTGTTQKGYDVWFMGYTPRVALGVWVGYNLNHPLLDDRRAKRVWSRVFQAATRTRPDLSPKKTAFEKPEGLEEAEICNVTGLLATEECRLAGNAVKETLPEDGIPDEICLLHGTERVVKVDGKEKVADPRTPEDMTEKKTGLRVSEEDRERYQYYRGEKLPVEQDNRVSIGPPSPPRVESAPLPSGIRLSWNHTGDASVVGYRVYRDGQLVSSFPLGESLTYSGPPGSYAIRAVDVAGLESDDGLPSSWPLSPLPRAEVDNGMDRLEWNAVEGATAYRIYLAPSADGPYRLVAETSPTRWEQPSPSGARWYRITSVTPRGESSPSKSVPPKKGFPWF
ncbi:penicillin-binding protein [Melghirimyces profundicolus]|uniref:Penicillin-binding protein n=1 Tax=Melghirimyces profundicolus TaxID=1242148 RepID=A0A2T6BGL3_9BACL|nr:transglycosylase domain-containing protein [Melghirimyces profundicolus]PTX55202.1 penicillin-binding protein [Melghirimyces profundicolus]